MSRYLCSKIRCVYRAAALVYVVFTPLIWLTGWYMDVARAWDKIPMADKGYSVVRNFNDSNLDAPVEDGFIEDSWSSLASLMDEKRAVAARKQPQDLNDEEQQLLADNPRAHYFKVNPLYERGTKIPHIIPRRHMIVVDETDDPAKHMHQDMINTFKRAFFAPKPSLYPGHFTLNSFQQEEHMNHALSL